MTVKGQDTGSYEANFALLMFYIYMMYTTLWMGSIPLVYRYYCLCR